MRLLIDTNIFLEVILEHEKTEEAQALLSEVEKHEFFISDYSLHSIGLLLFRRGQYTIRCIPSVLERHDPRGRSYYNRLLSLGDGRRYPSGTAVRPRFR